MKGSECLEPGEGGEVGKTERSCEALQAIKDPSILLTP